MQTSSRRPEKLGLVHVAVKHGGTAFIVGSFTITATRNLTNISVLRKLESEGYHYDPVQSGKQVKSLEAGKEVTAWMITKLELLEPPLTWKTDSGSIAMLFWHSKGSNNRKQVMFLGSLLRGINILCIYCARVGAENTYWMYEPRALNRFRIWGSILDHFLNQSSY